MSKTTGLITRLISGEYQVKCGLEYYVCKPRGVFRHKNLAPLVGDKCEIDVESKTILNILPRKNTLIRPNCSNVDKVFLVFSVVEPDLNLNLLDRMLAYYEYNDIESIIIFTKLDLIKDDKTLNELNDVKSYYEKIGYKVYLSKKDLSFDIVSDDVKDSICVFAGQSGAGKSTLLNLFGFNQKTDQISYALGRGKHTTRHSELLEVKDGFIADTPGFGILELDMDIVSLSQMFREFFKYSDECKFGGCTHINEPKCKIKELVDSGEIRKSRYENYLVFANEIKTRKVKY